MLRDEELMVEDLLKSGLTPEDLNARPLETPERTNTNTPITTNGYIIPYFHLDGRPTTFYRTRLFDHKPKYKQPQGTSSYIYFPKGFLKAAQTKPYVLITEGEKKAALATKLGFPCIGLGGVDAWRNRTIAVSDETGIDKRRGKLVAKIPQGTDVEELSSGYALGFQDFIDFAIARDKTVIIIFDTDFKEVKPAVQRAAATLAFELRYKGLPFNKIRQVVIPPSKDPRTPKVGLDDFFQSDPTAPQILQQLIQKAISDRGAFPRYPAIREYVNKRLQKSKLSRKELQAVSIAILATMDAEGMRLRSEQQNETFYFDKQTHALLKAEFTRVHDLHDTQFGQYLYRRFGLSKADRSTNEWLAAQFTGEDPIGRVSPHRVIARTNTREDSVTYQISDSQFVKVTATSLTLHNNGDAGVLFESEQVEPLDADKLLQEFERQKSNATNGHIKPLWMNVLSDVRLKDHGRQQQITALLYYMSPWLYRWRNLQLPVEQIIGESGSGKSTLMELRLAIINGQPRLRNAPTDLKDWHASIANSGGLHVTDNVQLVDRTLRQRLSDEIAQPLDALVLTDCGYRPMGEVHVGDTVIDPFGRRLNVLQEHPHGVKPVYRITLSDGSATESTGDHLWFVQTRDHIASGHFRYGRVLSLDQIRLSGLTYNGKNKRNKWWIPNVRPDIDLTRNDIEYNTIIDPYVLGVLLGDGNLSSKQISFYSLDDDIVERVRQNLPAGTSLGSAQLGNYYMRSASVVWGDIDALKLRGCFSRTKFVPQSYLYTTASRRLSILQGLMDTDGTVHQSGTATFSSTSKHLADAVVWLTQSLGGRSKVSQRQDGVYQVTVGLPTHLIPFHCKRKRDIYATHSKPRQNVRSIVSIERVGEKEVKCLTVNSQEGLYVTNSFITTHNCRIITEPDPHIEMRKLYTNADLMRVPVRSVFAITAIKQPFQNADLIQRSIITELDKFASVSQDSFDAPIIVRYDSEWRNTHLATYNGREGWVAHHLLVLQRFFQLVKTGWNDKYQAKHRLINFEQTMCFMAKAVGISDDWIPEYLARTVDKALADSDWTFEGLKYFTDTMSQHYKPDSITAQTISDWATTHNEYSKCEMLINQRRLQRYMQEHKTMIATVIGLVETTNNFGKQVFKIIPTNQRPTALSEVPK